MPVRVAVRAGAAVESGPGGLGLIWNIGSGTLVSMIPNAHSSAAPAASPASTHGLAHPVGRPP